MQIELMLGTIKDDMPGNYEPEPEYLERFDKPFCYGDEEIKDSEDEEL